METIETMYTTEQLKNAIFFWGGYLSQWHPAQFVADNVQYSCAEQYMMAAKARMFGDFDILKEIMATHDPHKQKQLGRKVKNFDVEFWNLKAYDVVLVGNYNKFGQNPGLFDQLKKTGEQILVEASPYDKVWGIGLGADNSDRLNFDKWRGLNLLGLALMQVRDRLCTS